MGVVAERGLMHTTPRHVADAAGVSVGLAFVHATLAEPALGVIHQRAPGELTDGLIRALLHSRVDRLFRTGQATTS